MKIDSNGQSDLQAQILASRTVRETTPTGGAKPVVQASADASRGDSVELSSEARQLAQGSSLTPDRIEEIRQRIASGAYNTPAIAETVARGILVSGDL